MFLTITENMLRFASSMLDDVNIHDIAEYDDLYIELDGGLRRDTTIVVTGIFPSRNGEIILTIMY